MAEDSSHDAYFFPQVQVTVVTTRNQRVLNEANCEEAHIDVLKVIICDLLVGELVLGVLV